MKKHDKINYEGSFSSFTKNKSKVELLTKFNLSNNEIKNTITINKKQ